MSNDRPSDRVHTNDSPPDLNLLAAFAENRLAAGERARVIEHVSRCVNCRETVAALVREGSTAGAGSRSIMRRPAAWLALAAAVLLAIGLTARFRPLRVEPPQSAAISAPRSISAPATTDVPTSTPAATSPPPPAAPTSEGLLARRSGQRIVGGKTFHLVAGEWIDSGYDRLADLPVVQVATPAERAALLARLPALKPYAALGNRVVVVVDAVVYRFDVPLPDSRQ